MKQFQEMQQLNETVQNENEVAYATLRKYTLIIPELKTYFAKPQIIHEVCIRILKSAKDFLNW